MATLTPNGDTEVTVDTKGELKILAGTVVFNGTGFKSIDFVVPVGKKYILKFCSFNYTGTATVDFVYLRLYDGTNYVIADTVNTVAVGISYVLKPIHEVQLTNGFTINMLPYVSADTAGSGFAYALVQEIDA